MRRVEDLIELFYAGVPIGQRTLEAAIHQAIREGKGRVLDAGCGTDAPLTRKFTNEAWVVGIDLCRDLPKDLPVLSGDLSSLPFRDNAFSLIFSRSVFEHLARPQEVLREFNRVLQPNGLCIILTPNLLDYSSLVAKLTPQWFHRWFVQRVYVSAAYDTFPTLYRANTPGYFMALADQGSGWKVRQVSGIRHYPVNLGFSRILFRLGVAYDWAIARAGLTALQPSLLVVLEKQSCNPGRTEAADSGADLVRA